MERVDLRRRECEALRALFVACSMAVGEVAHVLCDFGAVTVVLADGTGCALREKDAASKMELLFRKNLYSVAAAMIRSQGGAEAAAQVAEVQRKYGDHLYSKGDYDGAMTQASRFNSTPSTLPISPYTAYSFPHVVPHPILPCRLCSHAFTSRACLLAPLVTWFGF